MEHPGPEQVYHSNLYDSVPARHPLRDLLRNARRGRQRVRYLDGGVRSKVPDSLPTLLSWADGQRGYAVCLIENIRPEWMASLGVAWGLDLSFFVDYAGTRDDGSVWDSVMVPDFHLTDEHSAPQRQWYIEGVLSNLRPDASRQSRVRRRAEFENVSYGLQATTRISYCRVNHRLYLFLVDPPFEREEEDPDMSLLTPSKLSLWVPYSTTIYGGVPIPQLYDMATFAPFELLQSFLDHSGHWHVLFGAQYEDLGPDTDVATNPQVLSQFLAASTWRTNVDHIDHELKRIAFRNLRPPNMRVNDRLHELREDLYTLRDLVGLARKFLSDGGTFPARFDAASQRLLEWPSDMLDDVSRRAEAAERFLMDTFQLLMSSISVLDSQSSIQSARRGVFLTQLAAIYLPLSLVTGIWGMNLKEIGDSPPPAWVTAVTFAVVTVATALLMLLLQYWRRLVDLCQGARHQVRHVFRKEGNALDLTVRVEPAKHVSSGMV